MYTRAVSGRRKRHLAKVAGLHTLGDVTASAVSPTNQVGFWDEDSTTCAGSTTRAAG